MYKHNEEIAYLCEDSKKPWDETHNLQQVRVWSPGVQLRVSGLLWSSGVSSKENTTCKELLRALKGLYDGVTGNHEVTGNHGESLLSRHLISSDLISRHFFPAFDTLAANKQTNHSESLHKEKPITLAPISCPSSRPCSPPAPLSQLTPKKNKKWGHPGFEPGSPANHDCVTTTGCFRTTRSRHTTSILMTLR